MQPVTLAYSLLQGGPVCDLIVHGCHWWSVRSLRCRVLDVPKAATFTLICSYAIYLSFRRIDDLSRTKKKKKKKTKNARSTLSAVILVKELGERFTLRPRPARRSARLRLKRNILFKVRSNLLRLIRDWWRGGGGYLCSTKT